MLQIIKLFQTLVNCPRLALFVRRLSQLRSTSSDVTSAQRLTALRDFPKALINQERNDILELCLQALQNCINLQSCAWTRDGSLTTDILKTLSRAPQLRELEVNGRNEYRYDERVLCDFKTLTKVTIIMPSSPVVNMLPQWTAFAGATLRHLTLICRVSARIFCDW